MIKSLIKAEAECTERIDIEPDKVLRPIGTRFEERMENISSTDPPCIAIWEVVDYVTTYRGRRGNAILFTRNEAIECVGTKEIEEVITVEDD